MAVSLAMVFFYAPLDADQGFLQKIFYVHVPLAIVALCGFVAAGLMAIAHLRTRDSKWDMRAYVAIHMSLIFGVATLITGSIWAKGSWGRWWAWDEPALVSFLIVFLLYATYQPLRFAVRLATAYVHPRVLGSTANLPPRMAFTFLVSLLGITLLYLTLCAYELAVKRARARLGALRRRAEQRAGMHDAAGPPPRRARSAAPSLAGAETLAAEAGRGGA